MDVASGRQIRTFRIVLPEDNGPAAANATIARRNTGDRLQGFVEILTQVPFRIDCTVRLQGFCQTWLPSDTLRSDGLSNQVSVGRFCILKQVQHLSTQTYENLLSTKDCFYKLPFEIVIPHHSIEVPQDTQEQFTSLPPSLQHGAVYHRNGARGIYMQPLIVYTLEAELKLPKPTNIYLNVVPRTSREVYITPVQLANPPLDTGDFPYEYRLTSTRRLKPRFWRCPVGLLEISTSEPQPLNLASPHPRSSTLLPIWLQFQEHVRYKKVPIHPSDWRLCIRTTIVAKTFYSVRPIFQNGQPTMRMARGSACMNVDVTNYSAETRTPAEMFWSLSRQNDGRNLWSSAIVVPINLPKYLPPTFLSVLGARRYSVRVQISIVNLHHSSLVLQAPLQVIFDPHVKKTEGQTQVDPEIVNCDILSLYTEQDDPGNRSPLPAYE